MTRARAALLPAAAVLLVFADVLVGRRAFFHFDLFHEHVPVWHVVSAALRAGESPFWLSGSHAGQPLLYTQEAPLFYPLTIPLLLTGAPAHFLVSLFTLIHLALAGAFAFFFVVDRTGDRDAALLGGFAYALGTRAVLSSLWPNAAGVTAFVPLILLGLARLRDGTPRAVPLLGGSCGLALLLSRPQSLLGAAPLLLAAGIWALLTAPDPRRSARGLLAAGTLGLAIGMPALLPVLAVHGEMSRSGALDPAERNVAALGTPGNEVKKLFVPPRPLDLRPEASSYPGVIPLALAAGGLYFAARRRSTLALALAAGGAVGFVFAFGDAGPYGLLSSLPVLSAMRAPARFLGSLSAAVALGAGLAAAEVPSRRVRRALALLTLADLAVHARLGAPLVSAAVYAQPSSLADSIRMLPADASGFPPRIWSVASLFDERLAGPNGPDLVRRRDGLASDRAMAYGIDGATGGAPPTARIAEVTRAAGVRSLELFGVARAVFPSSDGFSVVVPRRIVPRAFVAGKVVTVPGERVLEAIGRGDLVAGRMALVEESVAGADGRERPSGDARLVRRSSDRVELDASSAEGGVVVLRETFASGWNVEVDGKAGHLLRTDGAFLGVAVSPGPHRVVFGFRPPALVLSLVISACGWVVLFLLGVRARLGGVDR